jgi:GLPGLI family protein
MNYFKNLFFILFISFSVTSQNNTLASGLIEYEIATENFNTIQEVSDVQMRTTLMNTNNIFKSMTFILSYNASEAIFLTEMDEMIKDGDEIALIAANVFSNANTIFYTNLSENLNLRALDYLGEKFLINDGNSDVEWTVSNETKTILGYRCYRAFKEIEEHNQILNQKRTLIYEVWFTPDIPVSFGPIGLGGLPGLILEATRNNRFTYRARTIQFFEKPIELETNFKGTKISKEEFLKLISKRGVKR